MGATAPISWQLHTPDTLMLRPSWRLCWTNCLRVWARWGHVCLSQTWYSVWGCVDVETETHVMQVVHRAMVGSSGQVQVWCGVFDGCVQLGHCETVLLSVLYILWPCVLQFFFYSIAFSYVICLFPHEIDCRENHDHPLKVRPVGPHYWKGSI